MRLRIFPDGGVARLRVHGVVVPDPALLEGLTFDLAALENGGDVVACSDRFYSSPRNAISPGLSRVMGEGWETRRRRAAGNEWLACGSPGGGGVAGRGGHLRLHRELAGDGAGARVRGRGRRARDGASVGRCVVVGAAAPPDPAAAGHAASVPGGAAACDLVRLDVLPRRRCGPVRLYGSLTGEGLARLRERWAQTAL